MDKGRIFAKYYRIPANGKSAEVSGPSERVVRDQFADWVHDALNRLYDSPYLRRHPLAKLLLAEDDDPVARRSQSLRRLLLQGIEALLPPPDVPAQ